MDLWEQSQPYPLMFETEHILLKWFKDKVIEVTDVEVRKSFKHHREVDIERGINILIQKNLIKRTGTKTLVYVRKPEEDECIIRQIIEDVGSQGCSLRDLRASTKLPQNLISKTLKSLENKKIIKSVKNQRTKCKTYLLQDQNPDDSVTGGIWFTNGEVDIEFVNQVSKLVLNYLKRRTKFAESYEDNATLDDIVCFIESSGVVAIKITHKDLQRLINAMLGGNMIQELKGEKEMMYRSIEN